MKTSLSTFIGLALILCCSSIASGQRFYESFETPHVDTFPDNNGAWLNYGINTPGKTGPAASRGLSFVGDSGLTWTVDTGNVDITDTTEWVAATGVQSVDVNGWEPGSMFTEVDLAPGEYTLSFAFSKHTGAIGSASMDVLWDDAKVTGSPFVFSMDTTLEDMHWMNIEVPMVVPDTGSPTSSHTLRFTSLKQSGNITYGPVIDDVSIVPEPTSFLLCGFALIAIGLSRRLSRI